jgi:hypothetical protein
VTQNAPNNGVSKGLLDRIDGKVCIAIQIAHLIPVTGRGGIYGRVSDLSDTSGDALRRVLNSGDFLRGSLGAI